MECKGNYDIFNLATDTIIKWYEQTHTTITEKRPVRPNLDSVLLGILLAAKSQTSGALTTLANSHILSTHGLLRILVETYAILRWTLKVSTSDEKTKSDEFYKRLRSWELNRLWQDKKFLQNLSQTEEIKSALKQVEMDIEEYQKEGIEKLPCVEQLYNDLGKGWGEVYTKFYRRYSRAVHLNRNVTQKLAWIHYESETPKAILYKDDIEPDGDELLNIASISCDINMAIRGFYDWQCDTIRNEYKHLESTYDTAEWKSET
jgi:hypothetical protein